MYLLDTNALSELLKKRPLPSFIARVRQHPPEAFHTSIICVMEIRYGCSRRPDKTALWQRIAGEILPRVTILGIDLRQALLAGDMLALLSRRGERISLEDLLIAVTALSQGCTVVTANVRQFQRIPNLRVENWLL